MDIKPSIPKTIFFTVFDGKTGKKFTMSVLIVSATGRRRDIKILLCLSASVGKSLR